MKKISIDKTVFNSHASIDSLKSKAEQSGLDLMDFAQKLAEAANHSVKAPFAKFVVNKIDGAPTKGIVDFAILHTLMDKKEIAPPAREDTAEQAPANDATDAQAQEQTMQSISAANDDNITQALSKTSARMLKDDGSANTDNKGQSVAKRGSNAATEHSAATKKTIGVVDSNILDFSFAVTKNPYHIMTAACMLRTDTTLQQTDGAPFYARSGKMGDIQDADNIPQIANFIFAWVHDNIPEKDQPKFRENCQKLGLVGGEPGIGFTAQIA